MNRSDRRQGSKAIKRMAKGFKPIPLSDWGEWKDKDIFDKAEFGIVPPRNLYRFVANDRFSVQFYERRTAEFGTIAHLMIRPHDQKPVRDWYVLQRIKNELMGPERTAVEVFPPESELIDDANIYHLWVFPSGYQLPFSIR